MGVGVNQELKRRVKLTLFAKKPPTRASPRRRPVGVPGCSGGGGGRGRQRRGGGRDVVGGCGGGGR